MINKNSVVLYKNQPAVVTDTEGDKYVIRFCSVPATPTGKPAQYAAQKVREKDIVLLHPGPVSSLENLLSFSDDKIGSQLNETYELLLSEDETASASCSFQELAEIVRGGFFSDESWLLYKTLSESAEFMRDENSLKNGEIAFIPRDRSKVEELQRQSYEKEHAAEIRSAFLKRLRQRKLDLPDDARYMVDVESLALGKTDKSKTLKEAGLPQTPEKAHQVLLETGIWNITRNPHPVRFGFSLQSASEGLENPPEEERFPVPGVSFAIDNEWSTDPDDAVAWDGVYLWVHIADPASTVMPGSSIDKVAMARGATLYIPEGASRMLCEDSLEDYALGLREKSRALSFRIKLAKDGSVEDCSVMKTIVDVKRLTYQQADAMKDTPEIAPLYEIAERNITRRNKAGAISIDLPEVNITLDGTTKKVLVLPVDHPLSGDVIREMMLLAGEGAARFAFKNHIPFPYISQESPEIPDTVPDGLAGQIALIRCMKKRNVSITPSIHSALGIGMYSQVTSPLRRYSDLISHEQLRAFLDGRDLIDKDTLLERISAGDEAMRNNRKAERMSNTHWTLVYLLQNPEWTGEAVCVDKKGNQSVFLIPSLGMQTLMIPERKIQLNEKITVKAGNISIPELSVTFKQIS